MPDKKQLTEKCQRLEAENKVLRQIIQETVKALQNAEKFTSMTTLDTLQYVKSPYKNDKNQNYRYPFDHGDY